MKLCEVRTATHVEHGGKVMRIASKWGIDAEGRLAKPSEGGFGVITETGQRVSMWEAQAYYQETQEPPFMSTWVIYERPRDFPNQFVVRRHDIYRSDAEPRASEEYYAADSLEEIRERIPAGLCRLPRFENDDAKIVEVWL